MYRTSFFDGRTWSLTNKVSIRTSPRQGKSWLHKRHRFGQGGNVEISRRYSRDTVELSVTGRLDGYWSDHLASALDEEIRLGRHHLLLDLSDVVFMSSAGIGALVKSYNDLDSIQG